MISALLSTHKIQPLNSQLEPTIQTFPSNFRSISLITIPKIDPCFITGLMALSPISLLSTNTKT